MPSYFWGALASLAIVSSGGGNKTGVRIEGQPTMGNPLAKVRVVVFEEPKCPYCKRFTNQVYPKIKAKYIDTKQISYTVVPVSFLKGSMPAATALHCVYQQYGADSFFTLLDFIYQSQPPEDQDWATFENMQQMANEAIPGIVNLKSCMEAEASRKQIEQNTRYGNEVMGHLITPGIYVNGTRVSESTFEAVNKQVESELDEEQNDQRSLD